MSMWEPRSSHLYVGRGGACRLWLLCFLCVRGARAHTAPLQPPRRGVCVCVVCVCVRLYFSVLPCTPVCVRVHLWICAWARGLLCVPNLLVRVPCSTCVLVCAATCGCAAAHLLGVSGVCTRVCSWVLPCAQVCWEGRVCLF